VLTATRFTTVIAAENRKFGKTVEDKAALWDSLIAYSGPYRLEGDKLITSVDTSWNESGTVLNKRGYGSSKATDCI
jgi:hypothetical protein